MNTQGKEGKVLDLHRLAAEIAELSLEELGDLLGEFHVGRPQCDRASMDDLRWLAPDIRKIFAGFEVEGATLVEERAEMTWEEVTAGEGTYAELWLPCSEGVGALTLEGEVEVFTWEELRGMMRR